MSEDVIILRDDVPFEEAIVLINDYINDHENCRTSEIIYDLGLDVDQVIKILRILSECGFIEPRDIIPDSEQMPKEAKD